MLQRHLIVRLIPVCAALAILLPMSALGERNTGSRSRSEPNRNRAIGQDVSESPTADVLLSTPPVEDIEIGLLGTAWLARGIAHSYMKMAKVVAKNIVPKQTPELVETPVEEPPHPTGQGAETLPEPPPVSTPTPTLQNSKPELKLDPLPRPNRAEKISPEVVPTQSVDEIADDKFGMIEPEPGVPEPQESENPGSLPLIEVEVESPSRIDLSKSEAMAEANMPILSELMAKLEKLDAPEGEVEAGSSDQGRWRNDDGREAENHTVALNSSDAVAFRSPGDEALLSPGHGAEVNYPDNPNTNLVDGEISKLTPGIGVGSLGRDNPKVFALATLSTRSGFEQAIVLSPLSKLGIGAITTSVRAVDPAKLTFNRAAPAMPNPAVSSRVRSMSRGNAKQMQIALTFDDGPHPEFTNKILAILDHYSVDATFFYVGLQAKKYPQWVKMTNQAGHEIASQTYDHFRLPKLPLEEKQYQIDAYQRLIENTIGITPRFMRPPGGQLDDVTKRLLVERGMVLGLWDVALNDTRHGKTAADMLKTAKNEVRPGSILLVHDGIEATIEVLPDLIEYCQAQGYEFVTMSELAQGL